MQVLMIGFDHTMIAQKSSVPGDTRERHLKYAEALRQSYPDGRITVIVKTSSVSTLAQPIILSNGLTIYPVPCQRWKFVWDAMRVITPVLKREHFDLVTTQSPFDDGWLGVWLKRRFSIPLNVQMRSSFLDVPFWIKERPVIYRIFNVVGKWVARRANTIRVVSHGEKQRLEDRFPALQGKIFALHPLVNVSTFNKPLQQEEKEHVQCVLQQHGMNGKPFLFFAGRLVRQKNLPTLLHAFALVLQKTSKAALVIAGDGQLRGRLEELARQLGVDNHILWLGNVSLKALRGWYALAQGFVLPSFHEGVPKVLLESYLMGTPVIAAPFVSARELIQNEKTGFVTQSFTDSIELAEKMAYLLNTEDLSKKMAEEGKAHITNYLLPEDVYMTRLIEIWSKTAGVGCETPMV